jgi:zinc D-Ala-D-Ala carboxypeptidase
MVKKKDNKPKYWIPALLVGGFALTGLIVGFRRGVVSFDHTAQYGYDPNIFSRYYTPAQVYASATAISQGINNTPGDQEILNASLLAQMVLDPIADFLGTAADINSWYRSPQLNTAVGGSSTSDHLTGLAADIKSPDGDNKKILQAILQWYIPFDQLIIYDSIDNPSRVHVSYDAALSPADQKRQVLLKTSAGYQPVAYQTLYNQVA